MNNKITGSIGEEIAVNYLKNKKYKILHKNYTNKIGEIDIICFKDKYTIFVEVKNRSSFKFGRPMEAVDKRKQHKIKLVALLYMQHNDLLDKNVRFDVVEVCEKEVIGHIENAF